MSLSGPRPGHDSEGSAQGGTRGAEIGVGIALFALATWYCASAPYNLYVYDEGYFLYEAKRILNGEVFYRDFFNIVTPLAWYVMAGAYWLFGATMATARSTMALVHGAIVVAMVVAYRRLGIRLSIVIVAALAEVAVCYVAVERAAPHWFGTLFCVGLLMALLRRPLVTGRSAFIVGLLVGGLILTQQQRGVAMGWVPLIVLFIDRWLLAAPPARSLRTLIEGGCYYGAGVAAVVVPVMLTFVLVAGFENVWVALVQYPLFNYRDVHGAPWGHYNPIQDAYIGPVIKYLSLAIPVVAAGRCVWLWHAGASATTIRAIFVAVLVSLGAYLGILYVPMYAYVALVGPVWFVLVAELVEAGARAIERRSRYGWVAATIVVGAFAIFFTVRLVNRRLELQAQWPYVGDTPFGQMALAYEWDTEVLEAVKKTVSAPAEIIIYPTAPGLYLMTGTENISRFQILVPGYSSPEHVQEVLDLLESRRQPFVIRNWVWMNNDIDPILPYLTQRYERVKLPYPPKQLPLMTLYRRKPEPTPTGAF